jgi:ssDNA-binding Zn-finger/Zn-ribbon topoisomerase 1
MSYSGIDRAGANAGTSAPAGGTRVPEHTRNDNNNGDGSTALIVPPSRDNEIARFMPVMAIEQALERRKAIIEATQKLMTPGVDYGKIPGTEKDGKPARDCLFKPGAEKLGNIFGLVVQFETVKCVEDWDGQRHGGIPFFFYEIKARAYRGDFLMGEACGSCNSWESKYRYRNAERICPQCGKANIRKSKNGEGWYCWLKTDGCGATFAPGDPAIESQQVGKKINPDMPDLTNVILKMAEKRAKVAAIINATSASEFFTQDLDDQAEEPQLEDRPPAKPPRSARRTVAAEAPDPDPHGFRVDIGNAQYGTAEAAEHVARRKLSELQAAGPPPSPDKPRKLTIPARLNTARSGEIKTLFAQLRELLGEVIYQQEMEMAGCKTSIFDLRDYPKIQALYARMVARAATEAA